MINIKKTFNLKSIIAIFMIGFAFYTFGEQLLKSFQMQKEVRTVEMQINQTKIKNKELKQRVKDLESKDYVQKVAREKLGLVKPGEKVILRAKPGEDIKVQQGDNTYLRD